MLISRNDSVCPCLNGHIQEFIIGRVLNDRREAFNRLTIPLAELATRIGELDKSKAKTVVVICQNGTRSSQALAQLQKAGFEDALSLEGGIAAWQTAGLPVTK